MRLWAAPRPRAGDTPICPLCGGLWLKSRAVERDEVMDKAYVLEMITIPPMPNGRPNQWLGTRTRWARDVPEVME